jgi:membrane-bound ClpP family serine protease
MRPILFSVIIPALLIILGIIFILLDVEYGVFLSATGIIWLIVSFLIGYKDDEPQPLGMGRGRKR